MDLKLFMAVLWRFRLVVAAGTLLAVTIALISVVKVELRDGAPSIVHRTPETWESYSTVLLTQEGFPWGRSTLNDVVPLTDQGDVQYGPRFADFQRFQGLAYIYASLASGDEVRESLLKNGPIEGSYFADVPTSSDGKTSLPLIQIKGVADSSAGASMLANRVTTAFRAYLEDYQVANKVPKGDRVDVPVVQRAGQATLAEGRSMTRPIFFFLLMMTLVIGLAFLLENLRPEGRRHSTTDALDDVALVPVDGERDPDRRTLESAAG